MMRTCSLLTCVGISYCVCNSCRHLFITVFTPPAPTSRRWRHSVSGMSVRENARVRPWSYWPTKSSSVNRERGGLSRVTPFRGWHPNRSLNIFSGWIYENTGETIERWLEWWRWCVRAWLKRHYFWGRWLKTSSLFLGKKGDAISYRTVWHRP